MNWDNKELNRLTDDLARFLAGPDGLQDRDRRLAEAFLSYAYTLGKSDGRTEGVLSMAHKVSTAQ